MEYFIIAGLGANFWLFMDFRAIYLIFINLFTGVKNLLLLKVIFRILINPPSQTAIPTTILACNRSKSG
jgi:hypothetical protein